MKIQKGTIILILSIGVSLLTINSQILDVSHIQKDTSNINPTSIYDKEVSGSGIGSIFSKRSISLYIERSGGNIDLYLLTEEQHNYFLMYDETGEYVKKMTNIQSGIISIPNNGLIYLVIIPDSYVTISIYSIVESSYSINTFLIEMIVFVVALIGIIMLSKEKKIEEVEIVKNEDEIKVKKEVQKIICNKCGSKIGKNQKFCPNCGNPKKE